MRKNGDGMDKEEYEEESRRENRNERASSETY